MAAGTVLLSEITNAKVILFCQRFGLSKQDLVNLVLESLDDVTLGEMVHERHATGKPKSRQLAVKRLSSWNIRP